MSVTAEYKDSQTLFNFNWNKNSTKRRYFMFNLTMNVMPATRVTTVPLCYITLSFNTESEWTVLKVWEQNTVSFWLGMCFIMHHILSWWGGDFFTQKPWHYRVLRMWLSTVLPSLLDVVDIWVPLRTELAFVDAVKKCIYRQWFFQRANVLCKAESCHKHSVLVFILAILRWETFSNPWAICPGRDLFSHGGETLLNLAYKGLSLLRMHLSYSVISSPVTNKPIYLWNVPHT